MFIKSCSLIFDMEIRIDTNKDSKEEIKKIIKFLNDVVSDSNSSYSSQNANSIPDASPSMFNMFSEDTSSARDINIKTKDYNKDEDEELFTPKPRIDIIPY